MHFSIVLTTWIQCFLVEIKILKIFILNIFSASFVWNWFSFWFPDFHKLAFVFNCPLSKYSFEHSALTLKLWFISFVLSAKKHSNELGVFKMHQKMQPERLRHLSSRDRIVQSHASVSGLASQRYLSGRAHLFPIALCLWKVCCCCYFYFFYFGNG